MSKSIKTKFVKIIAVIDPDSGENVEVEIRKLETGGMVGIDGSFLMNTDEKVYSPYDRGVRLDIPDDEPRLPEHTPQTAEQRAADLVEAYRYAEPKYINARIKAAEIHVKDKRSTAEQRTYWQAIADGLRKILEK